MNSKKTTGPVSDRSTRGVEKDLLAVSLAVGDFIRYWGFRRIHGQIWSQLYLSKDPLSGTELVRRLKVSKALVSPALAELEEFDLIKQVGGDGKTKTYSATADVYSVIKKILAQRERKLIDRSANVVDRLRDHGGAGRLDQERVESLSKMIQSAKAALDLTIGFADEKTIDKWLDLAGEGEA